MWSLGSQCDVLDVRSGSFPVYATASRDAQVGRGDWPLFRAGPARHRTVYPTADIIGVVVQLFRFKVDQR